MATVEQVPGRVVDARRCSIAVDAVLIALAVVNLTAGVWRSLRPEASLDAARVFAWSDLWRSGVDPYSDVAREVDYPPNALVLLAPVGRSIASAPAAVWVGVNL